MARNVKAEVVASTFDEQASRHVKVAEMVLDKAKRMVESGHDVVIFLDSITRLARPQLGAARFGQGALGRCRCQRPAQTQAFLRRGPQHGGESSLTIIATALIDTGSKMDEVIFEEFKGTGNMGCSSTANSPTSASTRPWDVIASGTRREDLLLPRDVMNRTWVLRKYLSDMTPVEAMGSCKTDEPHGFQRGVPRHDEPLITRTETATPAESMKTTCF